MQPGDRKDCGPQINSEKWYGLIEIGASVQGLQEARVVSMIKNILFASAFLISVALSDEQSLVSNFTEKEYASVERIFFNNIDNLADFVRSLGKSK